MTRRRTVCIIPARGGSKGLPKKNVRPLAGFPLIDWTLACARDSGIFDKIILTSDSEEILNRAAPYGALALRRPAQLATDTASTESAIKHAIEHTGERNADEVTLLQVTSPVRSPLDLRKARQQFRAENLDSLFSSALLDCPFVWTDEAGVFDSVTFDYRNRKRRQDFKRQYIENGSIFIFKPDVLYLYGNRLGGRIGSYVMAPWKLFEVDRPELLDVADILIRHLLVREWPECSMLK